MGARKWHINRAEYHKTVADHLLKKTDFEDWALVALYYSALHFVDSVLADDPELPKDERHPRKHSGREPGARGRHDLVRVQLAAIRKDYRNLEELSRRTRYDVKQLGGGAATYARAESSWTAIEKYARMMHVTRQEIPTDAP